jgi:hypothetical protein
MRSGSIGIRAVSLLRHIDNGVDRRAGFTLIEALVALSLVLAFAGVLGPFVYQSHRILMQSDGQVRAEVFLRSLLATPFNRAKPEQGVRMGESDDLHWRIEVEPASAPPDDASSGKSKNKVNWILFRVRGHVAWGDGKVVTAETLRLGAPE